MEWHDRITATDDLALFEELNRLKTDSVILPASPDIPILPDSGIDEADDIWGIPDVVPFPTEEPAETVPPSTFPSYLL
jgi:hypothetical protein